MDRPIGVFDSGLGGLTVLKEIINILPNENIIYFGDTKRVPYGSMSEEIIIKYTFQAINLLLSKNVKAIVIACNTATALALSKCLDKYDLPIIGVIEAGARECLNITKNKVVGVIGTEATINSKKYNKELRKLDENIIVFEKSCPLFVPLVENGFSNKEESYLVAKNYLKDLINNNIDSLILGCTHYPILEETIKKVVGDNINLVNPAKETANDLKNILTENNLLNTSKTKSSYKYLVSHIDDKFESIANEFLGIKIEDIEKVDIQNY